MATGSPSSVPQLEREWELAVAEATGFDPRVIHAWAVQEGAYAPQGTGHLNFLNIAATSSSQPQSARHFRWYDTLQQAEQDSVYEIRRIVFGETAAQAQAGGVIGSYGGTPTSQIGRIAQSQWNSTPGDPHAHYGGPGGPELLARFRALFGASALTERAKIVAPPAHSVPGQPSLPGGPISSVGTHPGSAVVTAPDYGGAADAGSFDAVDAANAAKNAATGWLGDLEGFLLTWVWRGLLIVGGAVLIVAGLALMALGAKATAEGR